MSRRPSDVRATAAMGRVLWFGGIAAGAVVGGVASLLLALHYTKSKESS